MNVVQLVLDSTGMSITELANQLGVSRQLVFFWKKENRISPARIGQICRLTGLPPYLLSPDFPKPFEDCAYNHGSTKESTRALR